MIKGGREVKLAVLLMVHGTPSGFGRLLNRLNHPDITVFVHVDRKFPVAPFEKEAAHLSRVQFLPDAERCIVNWGGRSQVDAQLQLKRAAMSNSISFDRFLSLTGADYPICTNETLLANIGSVEGEIIRIDRKITYLTDNKISPLSLHDIRLLNPRNHHGMTQKFLRLLLGGFRKFRFGRLPQNMTIVHGSASYCLTRAAIQEILRWHSYSHVLYNSLRFSFSSDEIYFHTILYNSGFTFTQNYIDISSEGGNLYGLHYIDWSEEVESPPKVLGSEDMARIRSTMGALFVRKIDPSDSSFLDLLDGLSIRRS